MRTVQAGILAAVIALSAAACASTSVRPDDSSKSGTSAKVAPPAPLAGLTPDQIVQKALDNLLAATSVRISGNVPSQGENVSFDLTDGIEQSCSGTFAVTPSASSGNAARPVAAAIIEAGGTMYVKYATSYLESLHPTASEFAQFNGKYISVAPSKLEGLAEVCDLPGLVSTLDQQEGGFVAAGTATIDGQPALAFKQPGGTPPDIVYILDYAIPEILSIKELAHQDYYFDLSNLDTPFSVEAPPASEVVDGSTLGV